MRNIVADVKVLNYPTRDSIEDLTLEEIDKYIQGHSSWIMKFNNNDNYFYGNDSNTKTRESENESQPNNKIVIPNARSMVSSIKGYMYKPGLISYDAEKSYIEKINNINKANNEQIITAEHGEATSKYGVSFEILYSDFDDNKKAIPRFIKVKPQNLIPIYDTIVPDKLNCAIRFYNIVNLNTTTTKIEVYYPEKIIIYNKIEGKTTLLNEYAHVFKRVPVNVYQNNADHLADYEPVQSLIDAYNYLINDQFNELDRFARAYLVMQNYRLSDITDERKAFFDRLKKERIFFVDENGDVHFLTRDIPTQFFEILRKALREDIERHSHICDFRGDNFQGKSGEAMKWALLDMENLCGDKEAYFKKALNNRIALINNFLRISNTDIQDVTITFKRNLPADITAAIDMFTKLNGLISKKSSLKILENIGIITSVDEELKNIEDEKAKETDITNFYNQQLNNQNMQNNNLNQNNLSQGNANDQNNN